MVEAGEMKSYTRLAKIVTAEPMTEDAFLLADQKHRIDGARRMGYRPGFKVIDGESVFWVERDEFLRNYVEATE